ncbi:MAG: hypothetical protein ACQEP1_05470 [Nanobdellota archaeon]
MFVRLKKLKGKEYAYLVRNKWTKKGPRQKTKKYLGRCVVPDKAEEPDFNEYYNIDTEELVYGNDMKGVLSKLMEFELFKHGFSYHGKKMYKDNIVGRPKSLRVYDKETKNNIVLKINEGYLCEYMLKKILRFRFTGKEDDAYRFADSFVAAGISIPKEIFVELYRKLNNQ